MKKILLLCSLVICLGWNTPDKPANGIYDPKDYLTAEVEQQIVEINNELAKTQDSPQIGVYIVDSLEGEKIEDLSLHVARQWKIGYSDTNHGYLFTIAVNDRRLRLETSNNAAVIIPDSEASEIIGSIKREFNNKDYSTGVLKMVNMVKSNYIATHTSSELYETKRLDIGWLVLCGIIVAFGSLFLTLMMSIFNRKPKDRQSEPSKSITHVYHNKGLSASNCHNRAHARQNDYGFMAALTAAQGSNNKSKSMSTNKYKSTDDYHSSSSSSSDSWSGGGFDGGGASGGW